RLGGAKSEQRPSLGRAVVVGRREAGSVPSERVLGRIRAQGEARRGLLLLKRLPRGGEDLLLIVERRRRARRGLCESLGLDLVRQGRDEHALGKNVEGASAGVLDLRRRGAEIVRVQEHLSVHGKQYRSSVNTCCIHGIA